MNATNWETECVIPLKDVKTWVWVRVLIMKPSVLGTRTSAWVKGIHLRRENSRLTETLLEAKRPVSVNFQNLFCKQLGKSFKLILCIKSVMPASSKEVKWWTAFIKLRCKKASADPASCAGMGLLALSCFFTRRRSGCRSNSRKRPLFLDWELSPFSEDGLNLATIRSQALLQFSPYASN